MVIKVGEKEYYMHYDEWEKLKKFYSKLLYGKESLS